MRYNPHDVTYYEQLLFLAILHAMHKARKEKFGNLFQRTVVVILMCSVRINLPS